MAITAEKSGYAPVNGLKIYFEIHGDAEPGEEAPLVLLHGGMGSTAMVSHLVPGFAKRRQVILADLQAHGRTADIDRPMTYEAMADDISGLLKHLHIEKADLLGYSLGAGTAMQVAVRHPALVRRLVLVSMAFKREGCYPDVLAQMEYLGPAMAEQMKQSPPYQIYASIAPRLEDWPVLMTKLGDLIRKNYDWSKEVAAIKMPTMLVFGDADCVPPSHIAEFFGLLGGGKKDGGWDGSGLSNARLAILPGETHYNLIDSPLLAQVVGPFLDIH
jgi:pimeloyl-ACP methyl ester carboxylesterase